MKHKLLNGLGILVLVIALLPGSVYASPPPPNYEPMDVGPQIRAQEISPAMIDMPTPEEMAGELAAAEAAVTASDTDCVIDTKTFMILNNYTGRYSFAAFNLMGDGVISQIWVQANLAWFEGDPRETPVVTCEQVSAIQGEFENNIYPIEIDFFGTPDLHDGTYSLLEAWGYAEPGTYYDEAGRQIVLVSNVRDENYYDPTYPNYIAGFYSPTFEAYFDRNIMTIDAYDWANRTGSGGTRPYLYEGVFAHEYQHLLHDDYDSDEETWINEGLSDLAEELTGYPQGLEGHINAAAARPENSLVLWGDQGDREILTDYGMAYLFQHYLLENYGRPFIQALFHNQDNSITGVNSTLAMFGLDTSFTQIFRDWSVAMLIDSPSPRNGRYEFKDFDFNLDIGTPQDPNEEAFSTPGAPAWGNDYIWIDGDPKKLQKLVFDGMEFTAFPSKWSVVDGELWAGGGDLLDNWAIFPAVGGAVLTFDTHYAIEAYWDFAFVQVSTDNGQTWTSLANEATVTDYDPNAHPKVIANLPGLTGEQADLVTMSFDLSAYAGQDILIGFRYITDWATYEEGWFIDNVVYDGNIVSDGTSLAAFQDLTYYLPIKNDFTVTFVGMNQSKKGISYKVLVKKLSEMKQDGLFELTPLLKDSTSMVMMVSLEAAEDATHYADYSYELIYKGKGPKKK